MTGYSVRTVEKIIKANTAQRSRNSAPAGASSSAGITGNGAKLSHPRMSLRRRDQRRLKAERPTLPRSALNSFVRVPADPCGGCRVTREEERSRARTRHDVCHESPKKSIRQGRCAQRTGAPAASWWVRCRDSPRASGDPAAHELTGRFLVCPHGHAWRFNGTATVRGCVKTTVRAAPAGRGSLDLDESSSLAREPRLAGAVRADFSHILVSQGTRSLPRPVRSDGHGDISVIPHNPLTIGGILSQLLTLI